jgi:hypothetical protein
VCLTPQDRGTRSYLQARRKFVFTPGNEGIGLLNQAPKFAEISHLILIVELLFKVFLGRPWIMKNVKPFVSLSRISYFHSRLNHKYHLGLLLKNN